jgi:hypothetical protein
MLKEGKGNDVQALRLALAKAVASRKVSDEAISSVAKRLAASKYKIRGIDHCIYGICIDYIFDDEQWYHALPELVRVEKARARGIDILIWGIPWPEIFRVRVGQEFEELPAPNPEQLGGGLGGAIGGQLHG